MRSILTCMVVVLLSATAIFMQNVFADSIISTISLSSDAYKETTIGTTLYAVSNYDKKVVAVDTANGDAVSYIEIGGSTNLNEIFALGTNLYLLNTDGLTVIDTANGNSTSTISLGEAASPFAAIGTTLYASAASRIYVIDTANGNSVSTVEGMTGISYGDVVGTTLYVADQGTSNVYAIDTANGNSTSTIDVGLQGIQSLKAVGNKVYVSAWYFGPSRLSIIDTTNGNSVTALTDSDGLNFPSGIVGVGGKIYVANNISGTVSVIDAASDAYLSTISTGGNNLERIIALGSKLYLPRFNSGSVYVINTNTEGVSELAGEAGARYAVVIGNNVYVSNGTSQSITVIEQAVAPQQVSTVAASSITATTVTLNGSIDDAGDANATEHGFIYATTSDFSSEISTTTLGAFSGTGNFSQDLTGLISGTTYYFQAYSSNAYGTVYGTTESFALNQQISITTCQELQDMSAGLADEYSLANDIDCTGFDADNDGKGFKPVGNDSTPFTGSFNGNGHTISNLTITRPDEDYVGLFGYVQGGMFRDVSLAGNVEGRGYVGSLIGFSDTNEIVVENVFSAAGVTGNGTGVGGVIASMDLGPDSTLTNIHYNGTITVNGDGGQIDSIGGLSAGGGGSGSTISDSSASGAIVFNHVNDSQSSDVGGLVSYFQGVSITNSSSTMDISIITDVGSQVENVGGLVGAFYNDAGIVDGVSYSGTIHIESNAAASHIGGLVGDHAAGSITDAIADANIEIQAPSGAASFIGGLAGHSYMSLTANIDGVQALGSITIDAAEIYDIGGMIGLAEGSGANEISFVRSRSSVEMHLDSDAEAAYVGGFVAQSSMGLSFTDSYWNGQINATGTGAYVAFIGGMIGYHDTNPSTFTRTYAAGQMWLDSADAVSNIGGMTGYDNQAQYVDSFSAVGMTIVSVNPTSNIGAVAGSAYANFDNTFFDKTLSGLDCAGGDNHFPSECGGIENDSGYFKGNIVNPPLNQWSFGDVWLTVPNDYPVLFDSPITLSPSDLSLSEGDSNTFTVVLDQAPTDDVVITLATSTPGNGAGANVSPVLLTFTTSNWNQPQTVTVSAIDDSVQSGDRTVTITASSTSSDIVFDGLANRARVIITDPDAVNAAITNCAELQAMAYDPTQDYALLNDIDCTGFDPEGNGKGFIPVGNNIERFTGSFDGNGHTISNLTINRPLEDYAGLFGYALGGTFQNVNISGSITGGAGTVGSLIAYSNTNQLIIQNVTSSASVSGIQYMGGLLGSISMDAIITNSSYTGNITATVPDGWGGISDIGGLAGYLEEGSTIDASMASGTISVTVSDGGDVYYVGGLIGEYHGASISNSESTMHIDISGHGVVSGIGGIAGYYQNTGALVDGVAVSGNINIETMSGDPNIGVENIGGIFGYYDGPVFAHGTSASNISIVSDGYIYNVGGLISDGGVANVISIYNSYSTGDINATSNLSTVGSVGGIIGVATAAMIDQTYAVGNVIVNAGTEASNIGGLAGAASGSNVSNSFSAVAIAVTSSDPATNIGALIGQNGTSLGNNFYDKTISGQDFCTGNDDPDPAGCTAITGDSAYFKGNSANQPMNSWDFVDVWKTVTNDYPAFGNSPVSVSPRDISLTEGGSDDSFDIVLERQPSSDVVITLATSTPIAGSGAIISQQVLTFTSGNWDQPQTVTVSAIDDSTYNNIKTVTVTGTAASSDPDFNEAIVSSVTITIADDDGNTSFGTSGSGDGQLSGPRGVVTDSNGNIFVVDTGNNRIQKFDAAGNYLAQFGSSGSGDGEFNAPRYIAIDHSGNLYVTDFGNKRVQKFDANGTYLSQFGNASIFNQVQGIALDSMGNIYVADLGPTKVMKFDSNGSFITNIGSVGTGNGQFGGASGIAIDASDNIYITDSFLNHRVSKFNSAGMFQFFVSGGPGFLGPQGVTVSTSTGMLYVTDTSNHRIQQFSPDGIFIKSFGSQGSGDDQFTSPMGIFRDPRGYLYIADTSNNRIKIYAPVIASLTHQATSVLGTTATLHGSVYDISGVDAFQHGFIYSTASDFSSDVSTTTLGAFVGVGDYSADISGLTPGTTYYFRAYANNGTGVEYGQRLSFLTNNAQSVTTGGATLVTNSTVTLNGSIDDTMGADATEHGFIYSTVSDLSSGVSTTTLGAFAGTGDFSDELTGLISGTTYYFQAYSTNPVGTSYGSIQSFTAKTLVPITTCTELQAMSLDLDASYALANDIDCTGFDPDNDGKGFIPVGTSGDPFTGSFDGNGHTISNFTITRPDEDNVGLFGYVSGGVFRNFNFNGSVSGNEYVGSAVGYSNSRALLMDNVSSEATMQSGQGHAGGLLGVSSGAKVTLTNSHYSGTISAAANSGFAYGVGGLVGQIDSDNGESVIASSSSSGNIHASSSASSYFGGIIGYFTGASFVNISSTIDISLQADGDLSYIGGLAGYFISDEAIAQTVSSTGSIDITGQGVNYVGSLFGQADIASASTGTADVDMHINASNSAYAVGGLFGYADADFSVISASGSIDIVSVGGPQGIGGLAGDLRGPSMANATSTVNVSLQSDTSVIQIGGFAGFFGLAESAYDIYSSSTLAVNFGGGSSIGGFAGRNESQTIENIIALTDIQLVSISGMTSVGGLFGYSYTADGQGSLENVHVSGRINATSTNELQGIGGLIGQHTGGTISKTSSEVGLALSADSGYIDTVGGMIGGVTAPLSISDSYWAGAIHATSSQSYMNYIGGIIGVDGAGATISKSYAAGDIVASVANPNVIQGVAGLVGSARTNISNSFVAVSIATSSSDDLYVGAMTGYAADISTFTNSFYDKTLAGDRLCASDQGPDPAGCTGIEANPDYFKNNNTNAPLDSWNFNTTWLKVADGYPELGVVVVTPPDPGNGGGSGGSGGGGGSSGGGYSSGGGATIIYGNGTSTSTSTNPGVPVICLVGQIFNTATGQRCTAWTGANPAGGNGNAYRFLRDLSVGSTGEDVRQLQIFLNANGFKVANSGAGSPGKETTLFGAATKAAVAKYQASKGIKPAVGTFGPATRASVNAANGSNAASPTINPGPATPKPIPLMLGSKGPLVKTLRTALRALGYFAPYGSAPDVPANAGVETDIFGPTTETAVKKFQCDKVIICYGNPVSTGWGLVGPKTRALLGL